LKNEGPKGCNRYFVLVENLARKPANPLVDPGGSHQAGDNMSPPTNPAEGVTYSTSGGDAHVTQTVIEPSQIPSLEREGAGAGGQEGEHPEPVAANEAPEALERRFWAFVKDWPGFAGMPKEAAKRAWIKASAADRREAEAKRDGWLALLKRQGKSHVPAPSTMLSERLFAEVPWPGETAAAPRLAEPPFGPAWCAERIARLVAHRPVVSLTALDRHMIADGKIDAEAALREKALKARAQIIGFMDDQARQFKGVSVAPEALEAGRFYRAVSAGSDLWQRWRARFAALGWPWLPDMGRHPTAYFPACEPEGFDIHAAPASGLPLKGGADEPVPASGLPLKGGADEPVPASGLPLKGGADNQGRAA
jgi:hypothetical protein